MDQYMETVKYGDQDVMNNSTEVRPSDRTRQTERAVYRINPRTSEKELWLEQRPYDQTYRTRARLSRPSRHSKDNSRARHKVSNVLIMILTWQTIQTVPRASFSLPHWTQPVRMNLDSSRRVILTGLHHIPHLWVIYHFLVNVFIFYVLFSPQLLF